MTKIDDDGRDGNSARRERGIERGEEGERSYVCCVGQDKGSGVIDL